MAKTITDWTEDQLSRFIVQRIKPSNLPPALPLDHIEATKKLVIGDQLTLSPAAQKTITDLIPAPVAVAIIGGQVSSAGAGTSGSGFTAVRSSTGIYDITFDTAFSSVPAVVAMSSSGVAVCTAPTATVTTTGARIFTQNSSGTLGNNSFHFIAYAS